MLILPAPARNFELHDALHGIPTRYFGDMNHVEIFLEFDPEESMGQVQQKTIDLLQKRVEDLLGKADALIVPTSTLIKPLRRPSGTPEDLF